MSKRSISGITYCHIIIKVFIVTCETPAAMTAPACTIGPSLPSGRPLEQENIIPKALQRSVFTLTTRGIFKPFRKHFISGMPVYNINSLMY